MLHSAEGWTQEDIRFFSDLGCAYLPSIKGFIISSDAGYPNILMSAGQCVDKVAQPILNWEMLHWEKVARWAMFIPKKLLAYQNLLEAYSTTRFVQSHIQGPTG